MNEPPSPVTLPYAGEAPTRTSGSQERLGWEEQKHCKAESSCNRQSDVPEEPVCWQSLCLHPGLITRWFTGIRVTRGQSRAPQSPGRSPFALLHQDSSGRVKELEEALKPPMQDQRRKRSLPEHLTQRSPRHRDRFSHLQDSIASSSVTAPSRSAHQASSEAKAALDSILG